MINRPRPWYTLSIYYHNREAHDDLILDGVAPALDNVFARYGNVPAFFDRGWYRGPHIRLSIQSEEPYWRKQVRPILEGSLRRYLDETPSTGCLNPEAEVLQHRRLAVLEHVEGPLLPWHVDNSINFGTQTDRSIFVGGPAAFEFFNSYHADAHPLLLQMLDKIRQGSSRQEMCIRLMFMLAHTQCPPISRGFLSFHSHAEAFLANCSDPAGMRKRFQDLFNANAESLAGILSDAVESPASSDRYEDLQCNSAEDWLTLWNTYAKWGEKLLESRLVDFDRADSASAQNVSYSEFLTGLQNTGEWDRVRSSTWFRRYRLLLNAMYTHFSRVGVVPVERFLMCYLVARTVEDQIGMTAEECAARWGSTDT